MLNILTLTFYTSQFFRPNLHGDFILFILSLLTNMSERSRLREVFKVEPLFDPPLFEYPPKDYQDTDLERSRWW